MSDKSQEEKRQFVPRITQLDANEFDKEIRNVLFSEVMEISKYLRPGALNNIKQEISVILDLSIFYYSVVMKNATFGQELLSLKYDNLLSRNQVILYALMNYILPYVKKKYEHYSSRLHNIPIPVRKSVENIDILISIFSFLNTVVFLREGKYPTIVDRLLTLKYYPVNKINQPLGYNYMTRELLWHGFMELIMCVLPLINYKTLKRKLKQRLYSTLAQIKYETNIIYNPETKCVVCDDFPTLPCQISIYCPHPACYYCIKSNVLADEKFICPVCGETNTVNESLKFLAG